MIEHEKNSIKLSYETVLDLRPFAGSSPFSGPAVFPDSTDIRTFDALR
jgi:hypothetical protein